MRYRITKEGKILGGHVDVVISEHKGFYEVHIWYNVKRKLLIFNKTFSGHISKKVEKKYLTEEYLKQTISFNVCNIQIERRDVSDKTFIFKSSFAKGEFCVRYDGKDPYEVCRINAKIPFIGDIELIRN